MFGLSTFSGGVSVPLIVPSRSFGEPSLGLVFHGVLGRFVSSRISRSIFLPSTRHKEQTRSPTVAMFQSIGTLPGCSVRFTGTEGWFLFDRRGTRNFGRHHLDLHQRQHRTPCNPPEAITRFERKARAEAKARRIPRGSVSKGS